MPRKSPTVVTRRFKFKGVVRARRNKTITPEDRLQYVTMHKFESEECSLALTVRGRSSVKIEPR